MNTQYHNGIPFQSSTPRKVWRKIKKNIIVSSRDRIFKAGSSPADYNITLPAVYQNVYAATLKSIEIPLSFYTFSSCLGNNVINVTSGATTNNVRISNGNYTVNELTSELQNRLNESFGSGTFVCTYSSNNYRLTIDSSTNFSLNISSSAMSNTNCGLATNFPYNTEQNLAYFLGFTQSTHVPTASGGNYSLNGDFSLNACPMTFFIMEIDLLNKTDETALDNKKSGRVNGAFATIPMNGNAGDYVFLSDTGTNPLNRTVYNPPINKLSTLHVKFRDHEGRILDFNGMEHSFKIELELLDNNFDEYSGAEFSQF
ncbi:hypothetical protein EB118_06920 [bacterium]|nr:hypothetical protein [bacterium]